MGKFWTSDAELRELIRAETEKQLGEAVREIEMEWNQWYDKFRLLAARVGGRLKKLETGPEGSRTPDSTDPAQLVMPDSDRAAELNRQIMERRSRGVSNRRTG